MTDFLPFALPDITEREIAEVADALRSLWITTGPRAKELEKLFAQAVGAQHAVAVNSCTAALHLALEALGVKEGDEVIVPTMTFAATAEVVRYMNARPVLVDVLAADQQMDPAAFERAITQRTRAVIPVHFGGAACDMDRILEVAQARNVKVIEDAAHAFPASHAGRPVGSIGDVTCFSFYATKTITTGEGGMAVTDSAEWADRMRVMSLHGISKDAWKRYTAEGSWYYEIVAPGFKYNMTDVAAAMGLVQLSRAQEMLARRRAIARRYTEAFSRSDCFELLEVRDFDGHAWHLFVIRLVEGALSIDRNRFIGELKALGIGTSVHFIPLHVHPYYRDTYGHAPPDFPVALDCYERSLSLPIYSRMTDADVDRVVSAVGDLALRFRR
jgi:dTDP-4-amino-4,6-dideoxygalactose transaminase